MGAQPEVAILRTVLDSLNAGYWAVHAELRKRGACPHGRETTVSCEDKQYRICQDCGDVREVSVAAVRTR